MKHTLSVTAVAAFGIALASGLSCTTSVGGNSSVAAHPFDGWSLGLVSIEACSLIIT